MAIKRIDITDFREQGFLQEVNRQFLHPLGLALEVVVEADGTERLGGVQDYRDDPEGCIFGDGVMDPQKAENVDKLRAEKQPTRLESLGYVVQPLPPADLCPRCFKGHDTDGDGDCPVCAHLHDDELVVL
jgi:hypothetical protein